MRYKNKKTGCVAIVRDGKKMDADWVAADGNAGTPDASWKNEAIDQYASDLGIDTSKMKKEDKLEAIKAAENN